LKYIKVDSEGADPRILRSMEGLIHEFKPHIRCEVYRHMPEEDRREFFQFLLDLGYSIHRFVSLTEYRGPLLGLDDVCQSDHYDILAGPSENA